MSGCDESDCSKDNVSVCSLLRYFQDRTHELTLTLSRCQTFHRMPCPTLTPKERLCACMCVRGRARRSMYRRRRQLAQPPVGRIIHFDEELERSKTLSV